MIYSHVIASEGLMICRPPQICNHDEAEADVAFQVNRRIRVISGR